MRDFEGLKDGGYWLARICFVYKEIAAIGCGVERTCRELVVRQAAIKGIKEKLRGSLRSNWYRRDRFI